ncbi:ABC transporter C family protein [Cavenderia fasciculata]|uniref:ABC transporter C family protein n=1 Tax=Cavenderia fasciculata TaxID=261658 RepID=F4PNW4_CACFS|nr:ABC transporter C family protein [Cavenderia fasciculata]EGG23167.1 ABC transporter C family protein [Cavenderia fasciculata]|eukprot:XP_004361018.1 ABC transporter C family protein [Cavenderia fasciculata]
MYIGCPAAAAGYSAGCQVTVHSLSSVLCMLEKVSTTNSDETNINQQQEQEQEDNPYLSKPRFNDLSPEDNANIFQKLSFSWAQQTVDRGIVRALELPDIPKSPSFLHVETSSKKLDDFDWSKKNAIIRKCYQQFVFKSKGFIAIRLLTVLGSLITPFILQHFILFIQNKSDYPSWQGWLLCIALFVSSTLNSVGLQHGYWYGLLLTLQVRGSLTKIVFQKMLRLNNTSKRSYTGKLLNLVSVDIENFLDYFWSNCVDLVIHPLQVTLLLALLCYYIGLAGFFGFLVMALMIPLSTFTSTKVTKYFLVSLDFSDERIKLIGEFINGIRFLKLYNWEQSFIDRIQKYRDHQMAAQWRKFFFWSIDQTIIQLSNGLVLFVALSIYTIRGNELTAAIAFTVMTIFVLLREPINKLPEGCQRLLKVLSSGRRLEKFLNAPETSTKSLTERSLGGFEIVNGEFSWDDSSNFDDFDIDENGNEKKQDKEKDNQDDKMGLDDGADSLMMVEMLPIAETLGIEDRRRSVLKNINFLAPHGKLTIIVGKVGEGKSSLVSALIGEISKLGGTVYVPGSIGYTPQVAWMVSGSLRDNILFGKPYDKERYIKVIEACCLKPDLVQLAAKDLTEIGEKGINLSGGQKQRISLARCLYSNADSYVMDETLSAVDSEVAKHLFDHCITGMMDGKTRVLVTHQLQFLPRADHIVVVEQGGQLIQGTYRQLKEQIDFESILKSKLSSINKNDGETSENEQVKEVKKENGVENIDQENIDEVFQDIIDEANVSSSSSTPVIHHHHHHVEKKEINIDQCIYMDEDTTDENNILKSKAKLFVQEESSKGEVKKDIYLNYFKSGASTWLYVLIFVTYFSSQAIWQSSDYWLVIWSNHSIQPEPGSRFYLLVYMGFLIGFAALLTVRHLIITSMGWNASKSLHHKLLNNVFYSSCAFFDSNPAGRILNRFSKDINDIDETLVQAISDILFCGSNVILSLGIMIYVNPWILLPFILLLFVYNYVQKMYRASSRELKRMESIARSPVYSQLTETFNGLQSVRGFGQQARFTSEMSSRIDLNQRLFYHSFSVNRWLGVRLEALSTAMVLLSSIFSMLSASSNPGAAGLAVSSAIGLTGVLNWTIRQYTELEVKMNSVERVLEYVNTKPEGARVVESNRPPANWPQYGVVDFEDVEVRYRPTMEPSLRGITLRVSASNKVGIVGRTGAGKSTIGVALFRMLECSKGVIKIDGINIGDIGLSDLRSKLGVVPQEPFIFSGTVRMNLDPYNLYTDLQLWESLEKSQIKTIVQAMPNGLDSLLDEGGDGFSVGQKQLLCLSRALLRDAKVVLMDEASSSLDYHTDAIIKQVVHDNFKHSTVLTIAHRLDTIIDSDKILVVDAGRVIEYDHPTVLLENPSSKFTQLIQAQSHLLDTNHNNITPGGHIPNEIKSN